MWGVQKTLALIDDLHRTPCLWDVQCQDYKFRAKKEGELELLAQKYNVKSSEIEKKIQSLKTQFRREHRKLKDSERSGSSIKRALWFGYEGLSFLLEGYEARRFHPFYDTEDFEETSDTAISDDIRTDGMPDQEIKTEEMYSGVNESETPEVPQKKRRPLCSPFTREALNCIKVVTESISKSDEYTVYGEHLANKFRYCGRSRMEIAIAQHYIDEICFKLTMGAYDPSTSAHSNNENQSDLQNQPKMPIVMNPKLSPGHATFANPYSPDNSPFP